MKRPFSSIIALLLCLTVHGQQKDTVVAASHARGDYGENAIMSGNVGYAVNSFTPGILTTYCQSWTEETSSKHLLCRPER